MNKAGLLALAAVTLAASPAVAGARDWGLRAQERLHAHSARWFGISAPLEAGAIEGVAVPRVPGQDADDLVTLAKGLRARILTRQAANAADMFAFWPDDGSPTHLIFCIEGSRAAIGAQGTTLPGLGGVTKMNPSVQRIEVATGAVETVLRGLTSCDGIRRTPWQTVLATEEAAAGQAYEILDPLTSTNLTVTDRAAAAGAPGAIVDPDGNDAALRVVKRDALPRLAWEGLDVTPEGVVYGGDELRPGTATPDVDGGAIFKFVPSVPHAGGPIAALDASPLAAGGVWAFRAACQVGSSSQYGQGCEVGNGGWVEVAAASARADAAALGATGYYRPEDGHFDPTYGGPGVRFCWTNTGSVGAQHFGEVVCMADAEPLSSASAPVAQRFVEGDSTFNAFDNLDFQPFTGIAYVLEDDDNGEMYACLPDGDDRDVKADGCVAVLGVKDPTAEPTGFKFAGDGRTAVLSIQHSDDAACNAAPVSDCANADDYATDDILWVTGFEIRPNMLK
jgi:hypothetical protein